MFLESLEKSSGAAKLLGLLLLWCLWSPWACDAALPQSEGCAKEGCRESPVLRDARAPELREVASEALGPEAASRDGEAQEPPREGAREPGPEPRDAGHEPGPEPQPAPEPSVEATQKLPTWSDDPCVGLSSRTPGYKDVVARWVRSDAKAPPATGGVVVVGSSSIRLWRRIQVDLAPWQLAHRGYGGSLLWDTAAHAPQIITPYKPRAVLVYAGTNDIAAGATPAEVYTAYRCLIQQLNKSLPQVDIAFIGIAPNPARWGQWSRSSQLNGQIQALSSKWRGLHYIDIPTAFLRQGQPPPSRLFALDQLHLNDAGYALWASVLKPALQQIAPAQSYKAPQSQPASGSRALIDLGPQSGPDGAHTPSPDSFGQVWNNWHPLQGGGLTLPGEALSLVTTGGNATPWQLVLSSEFSCNGLRNGGLQNPDSAKLGNLAVASATQDYFFLSRLSPKANLTLSGLDPSKRYTLRLFASRAASQEVRVTRYSLLSSPTPQSKTLQTTGKGMANNGSYDGNDKDVASFTDLQPDAWGKLHLEVSIERGAYAYLAVVELAVQ